MIRPMAKRNYSPRSDILEEIFEIRSSKEILAIISKSTQLILRLMNN